MIWRAREVLRAPYFLHSCSRGGRGIQAILISPPSFSSNSRERLAVARIYFDGSVAPMEMERRDMDPFFSGPPIFVYRKLTRFILASAGCSGGAEMAIIVNNVTHHAMTINARAGKGAEAAPPSQYRAAISGSPDAYY